MRNKKQKNDSTAPRLCKHTQTTLKQSTKVKVIYWTDTKQKIENAMTRTFLKNKFTLKKNVFGQK